MKQRAAQLNRKRLPLFLGILLPALLFWGLAFSFDYYWDLNDDFLIDRILSGAYTGTPALHDIQNLFPFSALIALARRLIPAVDWYALTLLFLQFLSVGIIVCRFGRWAEAGRAAAPAGRKGPASPKKRRRTMGFSILCMTATFVLLTGEMLYHLVFVQYSVTVGLLSAAAAVILLTVPESGATGKGRRRICGILQETLGALVLIFIGFVIRPEMLLFCSPLIALAGLVRGMDLFLPCARSKGGCTGNPLEDSQAPLSGGSKREKDDEHTGGVRALLIWLLTIGVTAGVGLAVLEGIDAAAYSSAPWKTFRAFFNARTQLYDFERDWLKPYEEDQEFYDEIGLDRSEAALLWNYNFGMDEDITAQTLEEAASRAAAHARAEDPPARRWREALYSYRMTFSDGTLSTYNRISAWLYAVVIVLALAGFAGGMAEWSIRLLWETAAVFLTRSGLYLYLLYHHRPVERLTHCLFLLEAVLLLGLLLREGRRCFRIGNNREVPAPAGHDRITTERHSKERPGYQNILIAMALAALTGTVLVCLWSTLLVGQRTAEEYARREEVNRSWNDYLSYVKAHPDDFYFTDVYSTVDFSEKMADNKKVMASNWDFAGGWACHSPLWKEKLRRYGMTSMEEALPDNDHVFFAAREGSRTTWLEDYYRFRGREVRVEASGETAGGFVLYRIETKRQ